MKKLTKNQKVYGGIAAVVVTGIIIFAVKKKSANNSGGNQFATAGVKPNRSTDSSIKNPAFVDLKI